ncbi:MAG: nidogen-like domain-containing protein [Polyangiales bacterium]
MTQQTKRSTGWLRAGRALAATVAAVAMTVVAGREAEAIPLIRGLGGPADFGTNELYYNDDGSSSVINVAGAFPFGLTFFGRTFRELYVNNNGNITFGGPLSTYTPAPFPVANQRMIAPWWGDVDTRGMGRPARNGVYWDIRPGQFTVTWYLVGYFSSHDDLQNSFQMILRPAPSCGSGDFDVEFRYERCQWTTGDASGGSGGFGGTPAQAGFDAGDRVNFFALPGSRMMSVLNLCTTSNVGEPGRWLFQIRGGELPCLGSGDPCSTGLYGACARGTVQCRSGRPYCAPDNIPRVERCDGVDNDCDGTTDEADREPPPVVPPRDPDAGVWMPDAAAPGDASTDASMSLPDAMGGSSDAAMAADAAADGGAVVPRICPRNGDVCVAGNCVTGCVEGACFGDQTCTAQNACVETTCLNVNCPTGQTCRGGMCVDPCAGVMCPAPTTCRFGTCQNLCEGVTCEALQVCREGRCVAGCQCVGCAAGEVCQMDGTCTPQLCVGAMCDPGDLCDSRGRCVNPCEGATCPAGQTCDRTQRRCVDVAPPGPEPIVDSGVAPPDDAAGATEDGGMTVMDASAGDAGGGGGLRRPGCACRAPASAPNGNGGLALVAMMAGAAAVMARRRSARR